MQQKGVTLPIMAPILKRFCRLSMGENVKGMHAFPAFECPNGLVSFCFRVWAMKPTSRGGYGLEDEEERPDLRDNPVVLWQIPQLPRLPILQRVERFFDAPLSMHASTLRYWHEGAKGVDARRNARGRRSRWRKRHGSWGEIWQCDESYCSSCCQWSEVRLSTECNATYLQPKSSTNQLSGSNLNLAGLEARRSVVDMVSVSRRKRRKKINYWTMHYLGCCPKQGVEEERYGEEQVKMMMQRGCSQ